MQLSHYHSPYQRNVIFGSQGSSFSTQWRGCGCVHITTQDLLPKIIKHAILAAHINHSSTTIIIIIHDDWTNNPTNLLQQPNVAPILTIPPLSLQYIETLPFPAYKKKHKILTHLHSNTLPHTHHTTNST